MPPSQLSVWRPRLRVEWAGSPLAAERVEAQAESMGLCPLTAERVEAQAESRVCPPIAERFEAQAERRVPPSQLSVLRPRLRVEWVCAPSQLSV